MSVTDVAQLNRAAWRNVAVLAGFCVVLLFFGLGDLPFYTRGEPREGLVVWEMYSSGNWVLPAVNGDYIPFKPPLFHWFALLCGYLFGRIDEFTLRLPSALLAAAAVLLIYRIGARFWGEKAGVVAGIVLATCTEWWQAGTDTQVDMTLAFFISAACLYFDFLYHQRDFSLLQSLGLPLLLGLATLAKGPIGVALPCFIFLLFLWLRHDFAFVKKLHLFPGAVVFVAVAGSWYAAALWQGGHAFFFRQIVDENFRTAAGTYGHHQPIYYYLPILLENMLPWSLFIPCVGLFLYERRRQLDQERVLFPLIWLLGVLIFFSASLGKRGVYILPLYPAMALLFGAWWQQLDQDQGRTAALARWIGYFFSAASFVAIIAILFYYLAPSEIVNSNFFADPKRFKNVSQALNSLAPASLPVQVSLVVYAATLGWLIWALLKRNWRHTFAGLALITVAVSVIIKSAVLPPRVFERTMKPFTLRLDKEVAADQPLLFYRDADYGVMFYARRHIPSYAAEAEKLKPPFFLLIWEEDLAALTPRKELKPVDISAGLGPAGRHRLVLVQYQPDLISPAEPLPVDCPRHGSRINSGNQCNSAFEMD